MTLKVEVQFLDGAPPLFAFKTRLRRGNDIRHTKNMTPRTFGDAIREARIARHLSAQELADALGMSKPAIIRIETSPGAPTDENLIWMLAKVLEIDVDVLFSLAGRFGLKEQRFLKVRPTLRKIVRHFTELQFSEADLTRVMEELLTLGRAH